MSAVRSARAWRAIAAVVVTVAVGTGNSVAAVVTPVVVVVVVVAVVRRRSCDAHMAVTLFVQPSADVLAPASIVS